MRVSRRSQFLPILLSSCQIAAVIGSFDQITFIPQKSFKYLARIIDDHLSSKNRGPHKVNLIMQLRGYFENLVIVDEPAASICTKGTVSNASEK